jgi:hypothetical protein
MKPYAILGIESVMAITKRRFPRARSVRLSLVLAD